MKMWRCNTCRYVYRGNKPPEACPRCGSDKEEFDLLPGEPSSLRAQKLKPTDFLVINGSCHRSGNSRLFAEMAVAVFEEQKKSHQIINLADWRIDPCWCCYSRKQELCRLPCQNQEDDMKYLYPLLLSCRGLLIASPINWNNLSATLKHFLDRLTAIQNMFLLKNETPMLGKVAGIIMNGHEDGAYKTAFDILMYLENLGCVLAPYGIVYTTHGRLFKTQDDRKYFSTDKTTREFCRAAANNVIKFSEVDFDYKKIIPAAE